MYYRWKSLSHLLQTLFVGIAIKSVSGIREGQVSVGFKRLIRYWGTGKGRRCIFAHLRVASNSDSLRMMEFLMVWTVSQMTACQ